MIQEYIQHDFLSDENTSQAVAKLATSTDLERGAIYTKREVTDFMLDLSGYTADKKLNQCRILEPSFGLGDFLIPLVERLLVSCQRFGNKPSREAITAVELHKESYEKTRYKLEMMLAENGISSQTANGLLDSWLIQGDYLLETIEKRFTHVVGNPPYVRQERIPDDLLREYRNRYQSLYDRADLYVPFIERSLRLLDESGSCCFICSDRWMKNKYGARLRAMVSSGYHLVHYVDMVDTPAFHSEVVAYPAITHIVRKSSSSTRIAIKPKIDKGSFNRLLNKLQGADYQGHTAQLNTDSDEPWMLDEPLKLAVMRKIEAAFPTIEEAGCKVGIGVATGADGVFIHRGRVDIESDRLMPLVGTKEIASGKIAWNKLYILNPYHANGSLVDLREYPKLATIFNAHAEVLKKRHTAKKSPDKWYKTIDRIYPDLQKKPKLLIPDIKGVPHIVCDKGEYYPHHNLYYITSTDWELQSLRVIMESFIAKMFIEMYSIKMRGGYLRYQAQYLRRIRIPQWSDVSHKQRGMLVALAENHDPNARDRFVAELYGLNSKEIDALLGSDETITHAA